MKKLTIVFALVLIANTLSAQIKKGNWLAGGNINFSSTTYKNYSGAGVVNFSFMPDVGYFVIDKLALGVRMNYYVSNPRGYYATTSLSAAPFVRYYFLPAAQKINLFADASYGFGTTGYGNEDNRGFHYVFISAGPAFFLSRNVALEFSLNYSNYGGEAYTVPYANNEYSVFGVNLGFQIHLGK